MGLTISKTIDMLTGGMFKEKPTRVLMLGLDAAGKTTILYKLQLNELVTSIPTIGFNVEQLKYKGLDMTIWDVGGQDKIRALWRFYFENTDALIYVVDSADPDRLVEARDELHKMCADDALRNACVLVLANKQDAHNALAADKVGEAMQMNSIRKQKWFLQPCSAVTGSGLYEGLDWMQRTLREQRRNKTAGG